MAVYVDDMRLPARVGRIEARWSHLMADTDDELHAFAASIGLRRSWAQNPGTWKSHYDVTDSKRAQAIRAGAVAIECGSPAWQALVRQKREQQPPAARLSVPLTGFQSTHKPGAEAASKAKRIPLFCAAVMTALVGGFTALLPHVVGGRPLAAPGPAQIIVEFVRSVSHHPVILQAGGPVHMSLDQDDSSPPATKCVVGTVHYKDGRHYD